MELKLTLIDLRPVRNTIMLIFEVYSENFEIPREPAILRFSKFGDNCRICIDFISGKSICINSDICLEVCEDVTLQVLFKFRDSKFVLFKSCYIEDFKIYLDYVETT